jgi:shikimate 5-dehydrogenase
MLVYQAAAQLELWSEHEAPVGVMATAFDEAGKSL